MDIQFDNQEIYCRKLGHYLTFEYCRQEHQVSPCPKIRDCWFNRINVNQFLADNYIEEDLKSIENRAQPKIFTIVELIHQAKNNSNQL